MRHSAAIPIHASVETRDRPHTACTWSGVAIIAIGAYFPGRGITPSLLVWVIGRAIILPRSIRSIRSIRAIVRIHRADWPDIELPAEPAVEESAHGR